MELTLDRLTKRFGAHIAVDRVSTTLKPGVTGLLGANGAGKTTLMRMVCDVLRPTEGRVLWNGQDALSMGEDYRSLLGYLPQDFGYYPDFSSLEFMRYMATLKGFGKREGLARSEQLLEEVGLGDHLRAKVKTFSGGMVQRLGIAQAMINDPAILVLDEPTAGLDPKERVRFRNLIAGFAKDKVVVLSTHIVSDVEFTANRVLVMQSGRFIMDDAPEGLVERAAGKVWECRVDQVGMREVGVRGTVANAHYADDGTAVLRVVADEAPVEGARRVPPTLEDLYLYVFRDGGMGNDI